MGQWISGHQQPGEIRTIYIEEQHEKKIYPLRWPASYSLFRAELFQLFPHLQKTKPLEFKFEDASQRHVTVCSESTYQALVPKHKSVSQHVDLYYVCLEGWV